MNNEFNVLGADLFGDEIKPKGRGPVAEKFTFPPFTILDAKQGDWQERKRAWALMGIRGELGRDVQTYNTAEWIKKNGLKGGCQDIPHSDLTYTGAAASLDYYRAKEGTREKSLHTGTSIFDPVLTELAYRWWSPERGQIVDPFAGGSVRGIVAKSLNRKYWGCDLRDEQIKANIKNAEEIFENYDGESLDMFGGKNLEWICGDSMDELQNAPEADFIFSCPPYGDLEVYSDNPNDLSNMDYHAFIAAYKRIILRAVMKLKNDSFACFVVGDFRDKKGFYRNFVSETITAFENAGARLYNEAILATSVGSASMRVTKQFEAGRKLAKTHQNVLVFCKGDWRKAAKKCKGEIHE